MTPENVCFCLNCGHENRKDARLCAGCGRGLPAVSVPHAPTAQLRMDDRPSYRLQGRTVIGRGHESDLPLDQDLKVSRQHALIEPKSGHFEISDTDSLHGTFVNDERITAPRLLQSGDRIRVGETVLIFQLVEPEAPAIAPREAQPTPVPDELAPPVVPAPAPAPPPGPAEGAESTVVDRPHMPGPAASPGQPGVVKRYGRAVYSSPMDAQVEYDLHIGLVLEKVRQEVLKGARIKWTTVLLDPVEEEPIIRITPSSAYLHISPGFREIRVKRTANAEAHFKVIAQIVPPDPRGRCEIRVDFDYHGETVKTMFLPVEVQHKFRLGPISIPHSYWGRITIIGSVVSAAGGVLPALVDMFGAGAVSMVGTFLGLLVIGVGLPVFLLGLFLARRSARKRARGF